MNSFGYPTVIPNLYLLIMYIRFLIGFTFSSQVLGHTLISLLLVAVFLVHATVFAPKVFLFTISHLFDQVLAK